jgi:RNA polymerase sigma-70 factor, ECF subfamily
VDLERRVNELLAAGDADAAAAETIRGLGAQIMRYLRSLLRDEDDAGDAFSRFVEKLWRALPSFRGECSLRGFCHRVAWGEAQHVKGEAYRRRGVRLRNTMASRIADEVRRSSSRERERRADHLTQLRAELDPEEQNLLALRLEQELSWREVALILAVPGEPPPTEAALRKRFERTKQKVAALARLRGLIG